MAAERYEGDTTDEHPESPPTQRDRRLVPVPIALAFALLALAIGFVVGRPGDPLDTSADAGFLRDMSTHHDQAVDMSLLVYDRSDDPAIQTLAYDIARTQQSQIGRMEGWLVQWDLSRRSSQPPMTWMAGHEHGETAVPETESTGLMPGMATDEQLGELREAEGVEAEIIFLELMIPHHEGGVRMAEAAAELANEDYVVDLATGMAESQEAEIRYLEELLAERR